MNIIRRVRDSVTGADQQPDNGNNDQRRYLRNFLLHFRPSSVPERTLAFRLSWGLGGSATVLVMLLLVTGLLLKFVYEPAPSLAYASIINLNEQVPFGQLLRNIHRWSGYGLLLVAFLHCLRVFYTSAFLPPRQFNWIIGLGLFFIAVLSNFTGYLLPWDQVSYWAITISTSMLDYIPLVGPELKHWLLGGTEPGPATLLNFYAIHTAVLPILLLFALPFHFWRVRKANGLVLLRSPDEVPQAPPTMANTVPHLVSRELAMGLLVIAVVFTISMLFDAPLAEQANPGLSPNPTKAPWYFMGIQEILMHFHPLFAVLVIPGLLAIGLLLIPYLCYDANTSGIWFCSAKGRKLVLLAAILGAALTLLAVLLDELLLAQGSNEPSSLLMNGVVPFTVVAMICLAFYVLLRRAWGANRNEAVQALFTLFLSSFTVLTLIGVWFRGTGMQLMWAG